MRDRDSGLAGSFPWLLAAVFLFAFALRLAFICQWFTTPYGQVPYLDAHAYDVWARDIAGGHWMRDRAFYQSPLFPYVLALLYKAFGHSFWTVALSNAVLGAATCALLAHVAGRCFGANAAALTGMMAAIYRPFIFYAAPILKETLELFLLALFLVFVIEALDTNRRKDFIFAGLCLGLATLTRGNIALVALPVLIFALAWWGKPALKECGFFFLAMFLTILPVTVHNAWVSHDFVAVTYAEGFNFYVGNRDGADGGNAYPAEVATGTAEETSTTQKAEAAAHHPLKPSEVSAYWMDKGIDFIALNPSKAFDLLERKVGLFFSTTEIPDNYNLDFFTANVPTILQGPFLGFGWVLGVAVFAFAAGTGGNRREMAFLLVMASAYTLSVLPFYVTDRYRLPVLVFLLPLAGAAAPAVWARWRPEHRGELVGPALVALICMMFSSDFPQPTVISDLVGWTDLSDIQFGLGRDTEALVSLRKAIALSPKDVAANFYMKGVYAEDRLDHHDAAADLLKEGTGMHPAEAASMEESYGRFMMDRRDWPAARDAFQEALRIAPDYIPALLGLTKTFIELGERKHALETARRGLVLDPGNGQLSALVDSLTLGR